MLLHNSHVLLYLNGLNPRIEHLDMFLNIWNLILCREAGKKQSSCYYDSKYGESILGKSSKQFKMQSRFLIFDPVI